MATFNKTNQFVGDLANGKYDFSSHVLKALLTNVAPTTATAIKSDLTEIAAGNGYSAGGVTLATQSDTDTSGTVKVIESADNTITASGGSIGPFRYLAIYNDTQTSPVKPVIGWVDYGSAITLATGESLLIDSDQVNGILQIS